MTCPNCGTTMEEGGRCPECPHVDDIYDCECDWCMGEREKWGHDIPEEESEYKCSGADYHLPNCGGECGYAD